MPRSSAKALPCLLLIILFILGLAACGGDGNTENPKAQALAKDLSSQISTLSPLLIEPLTKKDPKAAEAVLADFFLKASQAGKPLENGILVLDAKGVTFTERNPAPGHPSGVSNRPTAKDYSSYQMVRQALQNGRSELGVVYLNQDKLYVVCYPLGERKPVGVLVLGILGSCLEAKLAISGQQFLAMKISP